MASINPLRFARLTQLVFIVAACGLFIAARVAVAQEHAAPADKAAPAAHSSADADDNLPHPALSQDASWAGVVLIVILGMFLLAAAVGLAVRYNMPEELPPPAHSHDEPPGASHHHGPGGTVNVPEPDDTLGHRHGH